MACPPIHPHTHSYKHPVYNYTLDQTERKNEFPVNIQLFACQRFMFLTDRLLV